MNVCSLNVTSVTLRWETPLNMAGVPHKYNVTWDTTHEPSQSITTKETFAEVAGLTPGSDYLFSVCTVLECTEVKSALLHTTVRTNLPRPGKITVHRVTMDSVSLSWGPPEGLEGLCEMYMVTWSFMGKKNNIKVKNDRSVAVKQLSPGREYVFSVVTTRDGRSSKSRSNCVSVSVWTEPSPPLDLQAEEVRSRSVTLCWERPKDMDGVSYQYIITYNCNGEQPKSKTQESSITSAVFSDLKPAAEYVFTISTMIQAGNRSTGSSVRVCTKTCLDELLYDLGLQCNLKQKLTLSTILEISPVTMADGLNQSLKSLPWYFLRKLMMVNVTARSDMCTSKKDSDFQSTDSLLDHVFNVDDHRSGIHPLDVITAVFLCSDSFLQQEIVLKMSMCQFSVPLLLPNCDTRQCTLMLWAMRDIVKKFRPHSLKDQKGFVEESIVLLQLPLVSFVRLGERSLSKSHILNQVLSNPQQYHDTFVHHNMACGDTPKRISDGLVEISWSLPCGNRNIDIFPDPVAVANLRGDVGSLQTQFSFLCEASAAVFLFCDDLENFCEFLQPMNFKGQLFLVTNSQNTSFNLQNFKASISKLQIQTRNIIIKGPQMNDAEFVKKLHESVGNLVREPPFKISIEEMSKLAQELGIPVDEDAPQCQTSKKNAEEITARISDIPHFKEKELPLQGKVWKELTKLEKEQCRLRKAGGKSIEIYKSELSSQKQKLKEQQGSMDISDAMSSFMSAVSNSREERPYFLKWMRINLDTMSRKNLSHLREEYKKKCFNSPANKELISELDWQISSSSLGVEHFLREMGQLYESASSLPENQLAREQLKNLPLLCAELLQDGFPVELIDGDASNIPMKWVSAVLTELHHIMKCKCKIRVITVLGVQSTGKSTLLNTMFGVQFAVSSGRCTRGAFMLLIRVKEDFRKQLRCDYILVIDTEGLKSPELAQLDESYEHDNELATLVVGLSDITIINISMENSTEMKDILQIVVHAFLRMKEVGRKPCCQFVHQNVPDVSAHDKNLRERKLLLEQLNEMTEIAAKMEKRGHLKKFTDILEYNPEKNNWYIPGLWHGNPPMAPVNVGYSESVNEFKKSLIKSFTECQSPAHTFLEFLEWTQSLWKAVKYENFIFSFRNSLVADAYSKLCTEFNKWEWAFRKHMFSWLTGAETKISNFGTVASQPSVNAEDLLSTLKCEAIEQLTAQEKIILDNIDEYYRRQENHVYLVEKYKEDFMTSAKTLRMEAENLIKNKLETTSEIKKGMLRLDSIKKTYTDTMEQKVLMLIDRCRKIQSEMSEHQLGTEFGKMWDETVKELSFGGLDRRNVVQDIYNQLRINMARKGSNVQEILNNFSNLCECGKEPFKVQSGAQWFVKRIWNKFFGDEQKKRAQQMADQIINQSQEFVADKVQTKTDYHNTYIMDLLHLIDENLENHKNLETSVAFEASLKIHICGHAAREFQQMHHDFIQRNDPRCCLEQYKDQYCADFKDLFYERDQCHKKATEFANLCLKPAVGDYVKTSLGPDIVDKMSTGNNSFEFSTRSFFQFSILKQLLVDVNFKNYVKYILHYERFIKQWIFEQIVKHFSESTGTLQNLVESHQKEIIGKIKDAVSSAPTGGCEKSGGDICHFIQNICINLDKEVVIPKDALDKFMALNSANPEGFSKVLLKIIEEMGKTLSEEFEKKLDVREILTSLTFKPQDELFGRVFGCGKQCPFCKTPCEAGGKDHTEHFASIHRPEGIGRYRYDSSKKLVTHICSSSVASEMKFRCFETEGKYHPYKDYRDIFPNWLIQPDPSIESSDYWKYVFVKFNKEFAEEFKAKPADLPREWRSISKAQALKSLEETYMLKKQEDY
uniref:Si:dkey-204a24.11 n=2 Tax=Scleropages formosus TaxID=113540 RepID=A0A8C9TX42_SCLFO